MQILKYYTYFVLMPSNQPGPDLDLVFREERGGFCGLVDNEI